MDVEKKLLLRKTTGDQHLTEAQLRETLTNSQCRAADFVYDFSTKQWSRLGDHPLAASLFATKPAAPPDRRIIYFLAPSGGEHLSLLGPFTAKEIQSRAANRELCESTWVFVEGDKEWRQVRNVKVLRDMLQPLPTDVPQAAESDSLPAAPVAPELAAPAAPAVPPAPPEGPSFTAPPGEKSLSIELDDSRGSGEIVPPSPAAAPPAAPPSSVQAEEVNLMVEESTPVPAVAASAAPSASPAEPEREEITMAFDTMGLNLHSEQVGAADLTPPPTRAPAKMPPTPPAAPPSKTPTPPPPAAAKAPARQSLEAPKAAAESEQFDGLVAEIPTGPIWLIKPSTSDVVSGPYRFLDVIKLLEDGKLTRNDKIARTGTKAFTKISQQYEFNVKYSVENVVEKGQEIQKILIRRRHPRVPYITGVQITSKRGMQAGNCVNISAGGILVEMPKAEFNLGEAVEIKLLPGLISRTIFCKGLVIGKIPKIPPGFALKFEGLKPEDKEAIEFFVQESLKREMSKKP